MKKDREYVKVKDLKENDPIIVIEFFLMNQHYNIYDCRVKSNKYHLNSFDHKLEIEPYDKEKILYSNFRSEIIVKDPNERCYVLNDYIDPDIDDMNSFNEFLNRVNIYYCFSRRSAVETLNELIKDQQSYYTRDINRHKNEIKMLKTYQKADKIRNNSSRKLINKLFSDKDS